MITTLYHTNRFQAPGHDPVKIAVVSDLHDRDPRKVLSILKKEKPDLILVPGDLMERHEKGEITSEGVSSEFTEEIMIQYQGKRQHNWVRLLIKMLDGSSDWTKRRCYDRRNGYFFFKMASQIAPVCYSSGNHEWYHTPKDIAVFRKYNIYFLDNQTTTIHIKGLDLIIGGLPTKYDIDWLRTFAMQNTVENMNANLNHNCTRKILLMHHPEYYDRYVASMDNFDLIVSGHAHGGQIRLFGHGLYAPNQSFLPRYHHGLYRANGTFVVSAGASNTSLIPRIGNPTEVVIIL